MKLKSMTQNIVDHIKQDKLYKTIVEINSKHVCYIRVRTDSDIGHVYLFNVYNIMSCDTDTDEHLCHYNMILTDIAQC